jgi:hypothetical protein
LFFAERVEQEVLEKFPIRQYRLSQRQLGHKNTYVTRPFMLIA